MLCHERVTARLRHQLIRSKSMRNSYCRVMLGLQRSQARAVAEKLAFSTRHSSLTWPTLQAACSSTAGVIEQIGRPGERCPHAPEALKAMPRTGSAASTQGSMRLTGRETKTLEVRRICLGWTSLAWSQQVVATAVNQTRRSAN